MASISSPGVGSGMDVKTIVSQLMTTEQGSMNRLLKREATDQAKISAFGTLKSALSSFQTATQALNMSSTFSAVKPDVADSSFYTASLNGVAVAGSYNIDVKALAASQKLVSDNYADNNTVVGDGTLTISIGKYDAAVPPAFTPKSGASAVNITIDPKNHTLAGIRDAINAASAGVSASIINDGSGARLSITASDSGTANAVKIAVTEGAPAGLAKLAYDGSASSSLSQKVAAADAHLVVDGVDVYKPNNSVTDAVQGITLNLLKTTTAGTPVKLSLTRDTDKVRKALDDFVGAFNSVRKQMNNLTAYDKDTKKGSLLTGDATAATVESQLRSLLSGPVNGAPAGLATLTDIGVGFEKDGTLSVNAERRDKILNDPKKDVKRLFVKSSDGTVGIASKLNSALSDMIFGDDAVLNQRLTSLKDDVTKIGKSKDSENVRLLAVQDRYTKQFSSLDTLIASMNSTQQFLTQQLAQLNANK